MNNARRIALVAALALASLPASAQGTWVKKYEGKPVTQLIPISNQILVSVAGDSLLVSVDVGENWQVLLTEDGAQLHSAFLFDPQNGWVVGSPGVIVKMEKLPNGMSASRMQDTPKVDLYSVFFRDAANGWIGGADATLLSTRDGGHSWSSRTFQMKKGSAADSYAVRDIVFLSETNGVALLGSNQLIFSDDGGGQWRPLAFPEGTGLETLARQGQTLWLGGGRRLTPTLIAAGLWRSDDLGKSWKSVPLSDIYGAVTGLWFADANSGFLAARGKVYATTDGGQTWREVSDGSVAIEKISGADANTLWGIAGGVIYRYTQPTP